MLRSCVRQGPALWREEHSCVGWVWGERGEEGKDPWVKLHGEEKPEPKVSSSLEGGLPLPAVQASAQSCWERVNCFQRFGTAQ